MATVLEQCNTEEQRSVVLFLWAKGFYAKYINKEILPVYGGKCLSRNTTGSRSLANVTLMMKRLKRRCGSD
jgi:hypothetical protein